MAMRLVRNRTGLALAGGAAVLVVAAAVWVFAPHPAPSPDTPASVPAASPPAASPPAASATAPPAPSPAPPASTVSAAPPVDFATPVPSRTSSGWERSCVAVGSGAPLCMVARTVVATDGGDWLARLAVGPSGPGGTMRMVVTVPLGVLLTPALLLAIDDAPAFAAPLMICLADVGCQSVLSLDGAALDQLRGGQQMKLRYVRPDGRPLSLVVGLDGLAGALSGISPAN